MSPVEFLDARTVVLAGVAVAVGRPGALLLRAVLAAGGRAAVGDVVRAVWGERSPNPNHVYVVNHRVNRRLERAGCPRRVAVDGGDVVVC